MEAYYAFVRKIVEAFDGTGLDYAFTGALAISFYGVPRTTNDIDVIVAVANETDIKRKLATALHKAALEFDDRKIDTALTSGYPIATFKDSSSAFFVDVILSCEKLLKRTGKVNGSTTYFQTPEALIAAKLRMIKATIDPTRSAKDKKDLQGILEFTQVDLAAVKRQAKKDNTLQVFDALGLK